MSSCVLVFTAINLFITAGITAVYFCTTLAIIGEGNVPWMVRELILQAEPHPERQPRIVIG